MDNPIPTNPFYHRTPVRDPAYFFGRRREREQLRNLVRNGQSVALIGPRRIGKSSLLWQLVHDLTNPTTRDGTTPDARYCVVYFSGEAWQDQPAHALYCGLWDAVTMTLRTTPSLANLAAEADTTTELDFPTFLRELRQLTSQGVRLLFLLDEFDALSRNRYLDEFFFSSLRSLAAGPGVIFVTASTLPLLELTYAQQSALSSPFFNIFLPQRLGLMPDNEALALLQGTAALGGRALATEQQQWLLDLAGPHPCFLQIAGYHAWEARALGAAEDIPHLRQAIFTEAAPLWAYQWRYLSTDEQRALALLATAQPQSPSTLAQLQQACLLRASQARPGYLSPLLADFVRQQAIYQIIQAGPLLIDQEAQLAWLAGQALALSPQDYRLLTLLSTQAGRSLTRDELAQQLWPDEATAINHQDRLKTAINSLRRKLGDHGELVESAPNGGYRLRSDAA